MKRICSTIIIVLLLAFTVPSQAQWVIGGGSGGASSSLVCTKIPLTSANILAFDLTPIPIVAAQGVKTFIIPDATAIQTKIGTRAYTPFITGGGQLPGLYYGSAAPANFILGINDANIAMWTSNSTKTTFDSLPFSNSGISGSSPFNSFPLDPSFAENQPIVFGVDPNIGSYNAGPVTTMAVAVPGSGYAPGDTFTVDAGITFYDTGDATGHIVTAPGGIPATVAIDTPGTIYLVKTANPHSGPYPTLHTSGSGNNALTVNVTGAVVGDMTGSVSVCPLVMPLQ